MVRASCLCGDVAWEIDGPLAFMSHCHCGRCRKTHGAAFATYVGGPATTFRMHGRERICSASCMSGWSPSITNGSV